MQKKAYRVLEEVCASPQDPAARFVQSHLDDLKKTLLDSLRTTSSPAKRVRIQGRPALPEGGWDTGRGPQRAGVALRGSDRHPLALQPRLKCLIHIVKKLTAEHEEFITALVPEVRVPGEVYVCFGGSLECGS